MIIFPAIDIYEGQVVRLKQGDFKQKKVYHEDPLEQAKLFEQASANWLHIVDLEGAKTGQLHVLETLKKIKTDTKLRIQFGGGIRDLPTIHMLLALGIDRIVLGSFALKYPDEVKRLCESHADRIVISVDIKDHLVTYHGWQETSILDVFTYLNMLISYGVKYVMITDISKDGMLEGVNETLYQALKEKFKSLSMIASGGVTHLNDILVLKRYDLYGVITGVALYEQKFTLREALLCSKEESSPV